MTMNRLLRGSGLQWPCGFRGEAVTPTLPLLLLLLSSAAVPAVSSSSAPSSSSEVEDWVPEPFNVTDKSWYLDRNYRHAHARGLIATSHLTRDRAVRNLEWSGLQGCRHDPPVKTSTDTTDDLLPLSSTCPWNWVINYDPRRTPSTLLVAHCACRHCLSPGSAGHRCQPVHYFRHVVYFRGTEREMHRLYRLAVGCTCERHASSSPSF